jgi:PAS domain S-box-containing protein
MIPEDEERLRLLTEKLRRAEEAALRAQEVLSLAMQGGRMGTWSRDLATNLVSWSPELETIFGLKRGEFEGTETDFMALVHEEDRSAVQRAIEDAVREKTRYEVAFRIRHSSGEWRWMEGRGRASYDEAGRPTMLYGVGIDITDRKRADLERAYASAIVTSSDDAILSKTLDGIITTWNVGAERMFGYTAEEARGQRIDIIIPADHIQEEREILARLRRGERIEHYETVRRTKDGRLLDISLTISPVKDDRGAIIGASKIARDITERKRTEKELKDADRRKDEFLAILAHELRNPLAPVRNAVHYLKLKGLADPDSRRSIEMMDRQVSQMVRLIDDLLDVSRISRGVLELRRERFALTDIVEAASEASRDAIHAQRQTLHVTLPKKPIELEADRERLIQVLYNIFANATKYTPAGGRIDLTITASNRILEISVKDTGIGIPQEKLAEIFDLFARVDSSLERQGGMGIGLTLVRQLTELHGGTVEARSEGIGHGSEFILKLPVVATVAATSANTDRGPGRAVTPRRILVADDSHDAVDSLAILLQIQGHDVVKAYDGEAAIALAEKHKPEVLLLDIGMPKANGYEVAKSIRESAWGKRAYLIALTGWGQEGDKRRSQDVGFDAHIVKPVDLQDLTRLLDGIGPRKEMPAPR